MSNATLKTPKKGAVKRLAEKASKIHKAPIPQEAFDIIENRGKPKGLPPIKKSP